MLLKIWDLTLLYVCRQTGCASWPSSSCDNSQGIAFPKYFFPGARPKGAQTTLCRHLLPFEEQHLRVAHQCSAGDRHRFQLREINPASRAGRALVQEAGPLSVSIEVPLKEGLLRTCGFTIERKAFLDMTQNKGLPQLECLLQIKS